MYLCGPVVQKITAYITQMGKIDRARKYAEFIRQQHKSNQQSVQKKTSDQSLEEDQNEDRQRFVIAADSEQKRKEMKEKRKRVCFLRGCWNCIGGCL